VWQIIHQKVEFNGLDLLGDRLSVSGLLFSIKPQEIHQILNVLFGWGEVAIDKVHGVVDFVGNPGC